jgi:hypothetical protein
VQLQPTFCWLLTIWLIATPALSKDGGKEESTAADRCQTLPENGVTQPRDPADHPLDKLAECGGVLEPPSTGDTEITEPTPNIGETPVIGPGELPDQPRPD